MTSEVAFTAQDATDLAELLASRRKEIDLFQRGYAAAVRVGSLASAPEQGEKRVAQIRAEETGAKEDVARAQSAYQAAKQDAVSVVDAAKREREQIIEQAKKDAQTRLGNINQQIADKQAELKALSERAERARALLGQVV